MSLSRRARQLESVLAAGAAWYERLSWQRPQIEHHQEQLLRRLLTRATMRSPFHAERLAGVDRAGFTLDRLRELPVMTKQDLMTEFDRIVTDPRAHRRAAEAHLARTGDELTHLDDEYVVMASGGSSGVRGMFVYDDEGFTSYVLSLVRETLHTVRSFGVTGDTPVTGAIVAAGSTAHATAAAARLAGVAPSPVQMHAVPATLPFDTVLARLNDLQPAFLIAYGSMLPKLATAKANGQLTISPFVVSATSEPFSPTERAATEAAFGVPVGNTFGSSEGLVGLAPAGRDEFRFAEDTCIIELVDAEGQPVPDGEEADKVLVTNLVNLVQPLIRYELTDHMQRVNGDWPDGYLRATVSGRNDPPLRWGTVEVHPLAIRHVLVHHAEISEYQVHQTSTGIDVAVVNHRGDTIPTDQVTISLRAALLAAGLADATVTVTQVGQIERDPTTGKPRRFIPAA
jgi:phenylacetate-coenzyme A ligase PaaK-like adenylate-forming protein